MKNIMHCILPIKRTDSKAYNAQLAKYLWSTDTLSPWDSYHESVRSARGYTAIIYSLPSHLDFGNALEIIKYHPKHNVTFYTF